MSTIQIPNRVAAAILAAVLAVAMLVAINYRVQGSRELARQTAAVRVVTVHEIALAQAMVYADQVKQSVDAYTKAMGDALAPLQAAQAQADAEYAQAQAHAQAVQAEADAEAARQAQADAIIGGYVQTPGGPVIATTPSNP